MQHSAEHYVDGRHGHDGCAEVYPAGHYWRWHFFNNGWVADDPAFANEGSNYRFVGFDAGRLAVIGEVSGHYEQASLKEKAAECSMRFLNEDAGFSGAKITRPICPSKKMVDPAIVAPIL